MKLGDKIRYIRKTIKKMKLNELHNRLVLIFGQKAISYKSLMRIEKNKRDGRLKSIHQIACGLDIDVKELLSGTERAFHQEKMLFADIMRKKSRAGRFTYNDKAFIEILSSPKSSFMGVELILESKGTTRMEEYSEGTEILLVTTKGKITAHIHDEVHTIATGDSLYFKGYLPHYFENLERTTARAIFIQNPKSF
ncbi:MAG: cupin domain-containing protein [Candidatus Omnitrophota bacterium]|nr:cupin domain-containing protein [Candidatus Omnitrophota bacterium]